MGLGLNAGFYFYGWLLCVFVFVLNPNHTSWAPGPSDRLRAMETKSSKLCPKREGERDLSLGLGNVANKVKANISPKGGRGAEILGSGIFPS